jgi:hypothetical protein
VSAAWKAFAKAYHVHHFACPTCIAAGLGISQRCDIGSPLWSAYQENANVH